MKGGVPVIACTAVPYPWGDMYKQVRVVTPYTAYQSFANWIQKGKGKAFPYLQ